MQPLALHDQEDIAARLGLSLHTVETHLHSTAELVLIAVRRGTVT